MARFSIAENSRASWSYSGGLTSGLGDVQGAFRKARRTPIRQLLAALSPDRLIDRLYRLEPFQLERLRQQDRMRWPDAPASVRKIARTGKRRLWLERAITLIARNLTIGLTAVIAALVIDTLFVLPLLTAVALVIAAAFAIRGVVLAIIARPTDWQVMRSVDLRLGTKQQLATALELAHHQASGLLVDRQRSAALATAQSVNSRGGLPIRYPIRELRAAAGLLVASVLLIVLQPMIDLSALRGDRATDPAAQELARLQALEAELGIPLTDPEAMAEQPPSNVAEAVQQLLNRLFNPASGAEQVLADLDTAAATIQEEYSSSILREAALAQLAEAWKDGAATREIADAIERGDYEAAAAGIESLSESIPELSPDARQQIADGLTQAGERAAPLDQAISSLMQEAGRALETGDDRAASEQLSQLSQTTQQIGQEIGSREALAEALDTLSEGQMAIRDAMGDPTGMLSELEAATAADPATTGSQGGQEGTSDQASAQSEALGSAQAGGLLGQSRTSESTGDGSRDPNVAEGESVNVETRGLGGNVVEPGAPDPNAIPTRGTGGNRPVEPGYQGRVQSAPENNLIPWNLRPILRRYFSQPEPTE